MDKLNIVKKDINEYIDLSLESSRRIVGLSHITNQIGRDFSITSEVEIPEGFRSQEYFYL